MKTNISYMDKVREIAENLGWNITEYDDYVNLQTYTTYGQDCSIDLRIEEDPEEFCQEIYEYYEDFDVCAETYQWLDDTGHGTNGAPYDMMDVYHDMEEFQGKILELWRAVYNDLD